MAIHFETLGKHIYEAKEILECLVCGGGGLCAYVIYMLQAEETAF
jgi:hypothetical protein